MTRGFPLAHPARIAITATALLLVAPFTQATEAENSGSTTSNPARPVLSP